MSEWKDIETAPKNGETILLYMGPCPYVAKQNVIPAHWIGNCVWRNSTSGYDLTRTPTYWMPLPAPPQ